MVLHRKQAQFDRAKWRMAILLPCWILQMMLMLAMIGVFSYRLSNTIRKYEEDDEAGKIPAVELVWEITGIAFPFIGLLLTVFEIAKMARETLTPWTMLFTHVIKIVTSCASLAVDIVMYIERKDRHYSLIGLGMDAGLILIILVPSIYSIRTYRRLAAYDDYHHPANAKSFGYADLEQQQQQQQGAYNSRLSIGTIGTMGANSLRRLSSASLSNPTTQPDVDPVPLSNVGRTPSYYNHERDTQFDKYMIERAMSSEFSNGGFGNGAHSPGTNSPPNRSISNATDASSSTLGVVVNSGIVNNSKALRDSMGRTPSWGSSHVLVAVPEADEDSGEINARMGGNYRQSMDREALLGPRTRSGSDGSEPSRYGNEIRPSFEELDLGERKRKRDP